jgi:hypothetical protein
MIDSNYLDGIYENVGDFKLLNLNGFASIANTVTRPAKD